MTRKVLEYFALGIRNVQTSFDDFCSPILVKFNQGYSRRWKRGKDSQDKNPQNCANVYTGGGVNQKFNFLTDFL